MENLPFILLALACPVGMGLMMLFMGKGMMGMGRGRSHEMSGEQPSETTDPDKQLALLHAQRELVEAQIAAAEKAQGTNEMPAPRADAAHQ